MLDVTWMPYASIKRSTESLTDSQVESAWIAAYHTLRTLLGCRHPVESINRRLWDGYEIALSNYCVSLLAQIRMRELPDEYEHELFWALIEDAPRIQAYEKGFKNRPVDMSLDLIMTSTVKLYELELLPKWFGWSPLHKSHRIALKSEDDSKLIWPWSERVHKTAKNRTVKGSSTSARWHRRGDRTSRKATAG